MSKKKFSSGLDSLFDTSNDTMAFSEPSFSEPPTDSIGTGSVEEAPETVQIVQPIVTRRASSKNFTSDLESLFQDAFTQSVEQKVEKMRRSAGIEDPFEQEARPFKQPLSGLDALIRSTVDTSLAGLEHAPVKRLTIMFENQKIEKLKSIAKQERAFVKDIVSGVLTEFINDYEKKKQ